MSTPNITAASIRANGLFLDVTFDVPVSTNYTQLPADTTIYALNPVVTVGRTVITANLVSSTLTAVFELSPTVYAGDIVNVSFEGSRLNNANDRLQDSEGEIDNGSTQMRTRHACMTEKKGDFNNRDFNRLHPDRQSFSFDRH